MIILIIMDKNNIEEKLSELKKSKEILDNLVKRMWEADNQKLFWVDLFCLWIISRTNLLIAGFSDLLINKNFISSSSLIRLHLDSLLQLFWVWLVDKPHDFAKHKMDWGQTWHYKDKDWNKMKDWYLRKKFFESEDNKIFLGLKDIYSETSWFIHFSDKHILSQISLLKDWKFTMVLSDKMNHIPLNKENEAINAMLLITWWIIKYINSWIYTKENPHLCKKYKILWKK